MINFIEKKLSAFRSCFSRIATYKWFVVTIISLMIQLTVNFFKMDLHSLPAYATPFN